MSKLLSVGELTEFVPPDQLERPADEQITYALRTPRVYDRAKLRRMARKAGARSVDKVEITVALRRAIEQIYTAAGRPEEAARLVDLVDEYTALTAEPVPEDDKDVTDRLAELTAEVMEIEAVIERHSDAYRELLADQDYWRDIIRIVAIRLFLVGATNLPGGDIRATDVGAEGLTEAQADRIPAEHIPQLGSKALGLLAPTEQEAKN